MFLGNSNLFWFCVLIHSTQNNFKNKSKASGSQKIYYSSFLYSYIKKKVFITFASSWIVDISEI